MSDPPLLQLAGIAKRFGPVQALDGVHMAVTAGSIHGLIGENGAGKSTLMKILAGYQPADHGEIRFRGTRVRFASPADSRALGIGMLYQEPMDFPALSVLADFRAGGLERLPARRARSLFAETASTLGFHLDADARMGELSLGERQQAELVRLAAADCRLLVLDEPTTSISARQRQALFRALTQLRDQGRAIVLVSHKLAEIHELCDTVTVLRKGRVTASARRPFDERRLLEAMFGEQEAAQGPALQPRARKQARLFSGGACPCRPRCRAPRCPCP